MEDIEYLEEYEDLILPTISSNSNAVSATRKSMATTMPVDDEDSSSIDQDIFERLFDDHSDDDADLLKKDYANASQREHDSLDSIDMLVKDLGEEEEITDAPQKVTSTNTEINFKALQPDATRIVAGKPKSVATVRPTVQQQQQKQRAPPTTTAAATKLPANRANVTQAVAAPSTTQTTSSTAATARKSISAAATSTTNVGKNQADSNVANAPKKIIRAQPTIVKPEKTQSKDPVEDPLSFDRTTTNNDELDSDSDTFMFSEVSSDGTFAYLSDVDDDDDASGHVIELESNDSSYERTNAKELDKMRAHTPSPTVSDDAKSDKPGASNMDIIAALQATSTTVVESKSSTHTDVNATTRNTNAAVSTADLPEKATILSDTLLSSIDTSIIEAISEKEANSQSCKAAKIDMQTLEAAAATVNVVEQAQREMQVADDTITMADNEIGATEVVETAAAELTTHTEAESSINGATRKIDEPQSASVLVEEKSAESAKSDETETIVSNKETSKKDIGHSAAKPKGSEASPEIVEVQTSDSKKLQEKQSVSKKVETKAKETGEKSASTPKAIKTNLYTKEKKESARSTEKTEKSVPKANLQKTTCKNTTEKEKLQKESIDKEKSQKDTTDKEKTQKPTTKEKIEKNKYQKTSKEKIEKEKLKKSPSKESIEKEKSQKSPSKEAIEKEKLLKTPSKERIDKDKSQKSTRETSEKPRSQKPSKETSEKSEKQTPKELSEKPKLPKSSVGEANDKKKSEINTTSKGTNEKEKLQKSPTKETNEKFSKSTHRERSEKEKLHRTPSKEAIDKGNKHHQKTPSKETIEQKSLAHRESNEKHNSTTAEKTRSNSDKIHKINTKQHAERETTKQVRDKTQDKAIQNETSGLIAMQTNLRTHARESKKSAIHNSTEKEKDKERTSQATTQQEIVKESVTQNKTETVKKDDKTKTTVSEKAKPVETTKPQDKNRTNADKPKTAQESDKKPVVRKTEEHKQLRTEQNTKQNSEKSGAAVNSNKVNTKDDKTPTIKKKCTDVAVEKVNKTTKTVTSEPETTKSAHTTDTINAGNKTRDGSADTTNSTEESDAHSRRSLRKRYSDSPLPVNDAVKRLFKEPQVSEANLVKSREQTPVLNTTPTTTTTKRNLRSPAVSDKSGDDETPLAKKPKLDSMRRSVRSKIRDDHVDKVLSTSENDFEVEAARIKPRHSSQQELATNSKEISSVKRAQSDDAITAKKPGNNSEQNATTATKLKSPKTPQTAESKRETTTVEQRNATAAQSPTEEPKSKKPKIDATVAEAEKAQDNVKHAIATIIGVTISSANKSNESSKCTNAAANESAAAKNQITLRKSLRGRADDHTKTDSEPSSSVERKTKTTEYRVEQVNSNNTNAGNKIATQQQQTPTTIKRDLKSTKAATPQQQQNDSKTETKKSEESNVKTATPQASLKKTTTTALTKNTANTSEQNAKSNKAKVENTTQTRNAAEKSTVASALAQQKTPKKVTPKSSPSKSPGSAGSTVTFAEWLEQQKVEQEQKQNLEKNSSEMSTDKSHTENELAPNTQQNDANAQQPTTNTNDMLELPKSDEAANKDAVGPTTTTEQQSEKLGEQSTVELPLKDDKKLSATQSKEQVVSDNASNNKTVTTAKSTSTPKPFKPKKSEIEVLMESMSQEMRLMGLEKLLQGSKKRTAAKRCSETILRTMPNLSPYMSSPTVSTRSSDFKTPIAPPSLEKHTIISPTVVRQQLRATTKVRIADKAPLIKHRCRKLRVRINRAIFRAILQKQTAAAQLENARQFAAKHKYGEIEHNLALESTTDMTKTKAVNIATTTQLQLDSCGILKSLLTAPPTPMTKPKAIQAVTTIPATLPTGATTTTTMSSTNVAAMPHVTRMRTAAGRANVMTIPLQNRRLVAGAQQPPTTLNDSNNSLPNGSSDVETYLLTPMKSTTVNAAAAAVRKQQQQQQLQLQKQKQQQQQTKTAQYPIVTTTATTPSTYAALTQAAKSATATTTSTFVPPVVNATTAAEPFPNIELKQEIDDEHNALLSRTVPTAVTATTTANALDLLNNTAPVLSSTYQLRNANSNSNNNSNNVSAAVFGVAPDIVDERGTRLYSFLHPAKYNRSHGGVLLDYCCPNLDGPMPAIDPTRIHSQVHAAVRELPAYIVMTTKLITRADLEANKNSIPASIRQKVERITSNNNNSSTAMPCVSSTKTATATATLAAGATAQPTRLKNTLSALQKQLPATTTLTPKGLSTKAAPTQANSATSPPALAPLSATAASNAHHVTEYQRTMVRSNLRRFDAILKKNCMRLASLPLSERQRIVERVTATSTFTPKDVETSVRVLEAYVKVIDVPITPLNASATTATTPAATSAANTPKNKTSSQATQQQQFQRSVPIFDADKNIIGYQLQAATSAPPTPINTLTKTIMSTRSANASGNAAATSAALKQPAQDSPRIFYTKPPLQTSTPIASVSDAGETSSAIATPTSAALPTRADATHNSQRKLRGVSIRQFMAKGANTMATTTKTAITTQTLPTLTRNPHLKTSTNNNNNNSVTAPSSSHSNSSSTSSGTQATHTMRTVHLSGANDTMSTTITATKRMTRKTAAASKVIVYTKDSNGETQPQTDECILPDDDNATIAPSATIKREQDDEDFIGGT